MRIRVTDTRKAWLAQAGSLSVAILVAGISLTAIAAQAQPPGGGRRDDSASTSESFVARLFAFDANKDGKLSKDELTDRRLQGLFDRADSDHDSVVSNEELQALYARESVALQSGERGGPADGQGSPRGSGEPGGRGGRGGPPRPGEILPGFLQERLGLTDKQKHDLEALQKDVDAKLAKILTREQKQQLEEIQQRGPGGPPGPGGPGEFGPPGGGPRRTGRPGSGRPADSPENGGADKR